MEKSCCTYTPDIVSFLKTISEENRLKILCFLRDWEKCVCEIVEFLKIPQNLVSHHLRKLKDARILSARKDGMNVRYSINEDEIKRYVNNFNSLF
ncbi:MAG: bacterial regulatory protein, ArsR [uncultured bacterium (gcode 4)]|uniref:Bacterial regulatory protein, ArsR n=1 Tax=uncultured bacterium (gcode 4) TaxID=1234023 RepID=K1XJA5_9BACT|nr:MAG: bacterial regulatory protein, ArsR [uncultured bacterium (gcode 4)]